jgi:hypothetical protein
MIEVHPRVHERAKPASPVTTMNGTITPANDQSQRRSTGARRMSAEANLTLSG